MTLQARNTILIVDDMASGRIFLRNILKEDYELLEAGNGEQAMQQIYRHHKRIAAVILDLIMPVKDGYQTLDEIRKNGFLQEFPVLVVTSDSASKSEARVLDLGASDMILKPYDPYIVKRRVSNLVELFRDRRELEKRVDNLSNVLNMANISVVNTLATVTEFRSMENGQHILRIQTFAQILLHAVAKLFPEYELDDRKIDLIASAAILHDVGKVMIPDYVLNKPGKLTAEEFEIMKSHTTAGCEILSKMTGALNDEYMQYAYNICRYHHERWDGRGYPDGLKGDNTPLCAQVVAICDVYDALTTPRVYKEAFSHEKAVNMILNGECGQFNPEMLKCFCQVLSQFEACARAYADDQAGPQGRQLEITPIMKTVSTHSQQLSTVKYHTMFRLINGVVMEVDMDAGTYQLVYDTNGSFEELRTGYKLNDTLLKLLNTAVHLEDKRDAAEHLLAFQKEFFEQGLRRLSKRYRVRNSPEEAYFWVEATFLRVNTGQPNDRKAICVWQKLEGQMGAPSGTVPGAGRVESYLNRLPWVFLRCSQDRWLTVEQGAERLADMLGYTVEELRQTYQDRLIDLIVPEDREMVYSHLNKAREHGSNVDIEYRMRHKDGSVVWVFDKNKNVMEQDGREHVYRILLDHTAVRKEQEELRLLVERHQLLLSHANEMFFEWDLLKDRVFFTDNFKKTFGYDVEVENFTHRLLDSEEIIYTDDLPALRLLVDDARSGKKVADQDLRVMKADGAYLWCRLRLIAQQAETGRVVGLLGAITNINTDKLMMQSLQYQSEQDSLTGLYNSTAAARQIEQYLQGERKTKKAAILILDIDRFWSINERYGHMVGDTILISCGELLRRLFREGDLVARLGGDEFLVFIKDIPDRRIAEKGCRKIMAGFTETVASQVPECKISCSIGAVILPDMGEEYAQLFQKADQALMAAKESGGNRYAFYSEKEELKTMRASSGTRIESNERPNFTNQGLVEYALHHLYQSGNIEETIQAILEMVGRQFNVSRVYIFENSRDNRYCDNTFEWCNDGIPPAKEELQGLRYATTLKNWENNYDESGIFYCRDISVLPDAQRELLEMQGIKSMLHCAIMDSGIFRGFVGLDDCVARRFWTQEQLKVLSSMAEILALFLLKKRAQDDMVAWADSLLHVLNNGKDWIYVVEPDTYKILFLNNEMQMLAPDLRLGEPCYKGIMNRDSPCESCPIRKMKGRSNGMAEIVNHHLERCVTAEASDLLWDGRDAFLVVCEESRPYTQTE